MTPDIYTMGGGEWSFSVKNQSYLLDWRQRLHEVWEISLKQNDLLVITLFWPIIYLKQFNDGIESCEIFNQLLLQSLFH